MAKLSVSKRPSDPIECNVKTNSDRAETLQTAVAIFLDERGELTTSGQLGNSSANAHNYRLSRSTRPRRRFPTGDGLQACFAWSVFHSYV